MEVDASSQRAMNGNADEDIEIIEEKPIVKSQLDLYQDALAYEEKEVARRGPENDHKLFLDTCTIVRTILSEIFALKTKSTAKSAEDIEKRRVQFLMLTLNMRKLSRVQKVRVRLAREAALEGRQSVDNITLSLQGLLYEVLHLQKEANRCLQAHSADKDIDLMPVEEFYKDAPAEISRPEVTRSDEHEQKLARLHHELEKRREQSATVKTLTSEQAEVNEIMQQHKATLSTLAPRINAILQSTLPLQESLKLPLSALKEQQDMSHLLPLPLYTLWLQTSAYSEAGDRLLCSIIRGDKQKALAIHRKLLDQMNGPPQEEEIKSAAEMLEVHPLRVEVTISLAEGSSLMIQFQYAMTLRFITSRSIVVLKNVNMPGNTVHSDVLSEGDLLTCLFPGDMGTVSPNPATRHQFFRNSSTADANDPPLVPPQLGRAYKWAQQLSGLAFPDDTPGQSEKHLKELADEIKQEGEIQQQAVSSERVHVTLTAIRRRLRSRITLQLQLLKLHNCTSIKGVPVEGDDLKQLFPPSVTSDLVSWRPISWADYSKIPVTASYREAGFVTEGGFQYRAHFRRKQVDMLVYVWVSPDHPYTAPVCCVEVKWPDIHIPAAHMQQIEREVNVHWPELLPEDEDRSNLLPRILYRLAVCLDVFTEAMSARTPDAGQQFTQEKVFFRAARGPDRALPLKYLPKLRIFSHR